MKKTLVPCYRIGRVIVILLLILSVPFLAVAEESCRTGASALANAYVRLNPIYAYMYGDLESYVASNQIHFVSGGDSIRCAQALSRALMSEAIQSFDPNAARDAIRRKQELDTKLGLLGIQPGYTPSAPTISQYLYGLALQFDRLARVLPPAANGDYAPLYTPTNQIEQLQIFAQQMLVLLLQDPMVADAFRQQRPFIEEAANSEFQMIIAMARSLAHK